ncbi:MAG: hypothetical protein CMP38_00580 [Rickettsiales bacterium]|nr:hypothetical protein [Rickettsiales bacterium]
MKKKKVHKDDFDGYIQFGSLNKFLKETERDEHLERLNKKREFFKRKIENAKNQRKRDCLICGSNKKELVFVKSGFKHVLCKSCGFFYVDPTFNEEVTHSNFLNEDSYTKVLMNKANINLDKKKFLYALQKLNINLKNKKVLDIGCGFGFFLDVAQEHGCEVYGSELNQSCLKLLKKKKIPLINNYENYNEKFDIVSLWLVLEHLFDPALLLRQIHKLLKKNGKLIINIPNYKSLSARILKDKCSMFSGEQHINFFSIQNLEEFLNKNFFKTTLSETVISDIGTVKNFLNYSGDLDYSDEESELNFLEPNLIHKNGLGYTILNISKKIQNT